LAFLVKGKPPAELSLSRLSSTKGAFCNETLFIAAASRMSVSGDFPESLGDISIDFPGRPRGINLFVETTVELSAGLRSVGFPIRQCLWEFPNSRLAELSEKSRSIKKAPPNWRLFQGNHFKF
jgi:hypothetical protein